MIKKYRTTRSVFDDTENFEENYWKTGNLF